MSTPKDGLKDFFRWMLAFFLPPLAVVWQVGFKPHLLLNLLLVLGQFTVTAFLIYEEWSGMIAFSPVHLLLFFVLWWPTSPSIFHAIWVIANRDDEGRVVAGGFRTFVSLVTAIVLPPLGVLIKRGVGGALAINVVLWLLGCVPGQIHAALVITSDQ